MPQALPYLVFAVGAASAIDTRNRGKRAEKKQEELKDVANAQTADQAARERRNQIRQQRIAQSDIENRAAVAGQSSSSAAISSSANVQANVNSNIGNINSAVAFGGLKTNLQQDIFNLQQPSDLNLAAGVVSNIFETPKIKTT